MNNDLAPSPPPPAADDYSDLLETLYDSLLDNKGFENFLSCFKDRFNSASATLMAVQTNPRQLRWGWKVGISTEIERWYIDNGMVAKDPSIDLFEEMSRTRPGFIAAGLSLEEMTLIDTVSDEFRHWLAKEKIIDTTGLMFPASDDEYLILALQRNRQSGQFRQDEINRLNTLVPHIKKALQLFMLLYRQRHEKSSLLATINTLPRPTIVINKQLQIHHINTAAISFIHHNGNFRIENENFILADRELHRRFLDLALEMAVAAEKQQEVQTSTLVIRDPQSPVTITFSPIFASGRGSSFKGVLLQLFDPSTQNLPEAVHIQSIFRLTKTESTLCEYLVQGLTLKDIAKKRGVSFNTVREQVRNIFNKTGYSRQAELVASILRTLP